MATRLGESLPRPSGNGLYLLNSPYPQRLTGLPALETGACGGRTRLQSHQPQGGFTPRVRKDALDQFLHCVRRPPQLATSAQAAQPTGGRREMGPLPPAALFCILFITLGSTQILMVKEGWGLRKRLQKKGVEGRPRKSHQRAVDTHMKQVLPP